MNFQPWLRAGSGALRGPGEAAVIHIKECVQRRLGHQNYGFSFSWIPRFFKECYLWVWPFVGSRIIFQCISDPLVAFTQQNKMLRTLWVLGSKLNSVPQLLSLSYFISTMGKIHIMNCELKWNNDLHWQVLLLLSLPIPAWGTQEDWPLNYPLIWTLLQFGASGPKEAVPWLPSFSRDPVTWWTLTGGLLGPAIILPCLKILTHLILT